MQVSLTKKDLLRILARCQGVADKKSTMPVLGNVLLDATRTDAVRLAATDLYVAVSGKIPARIEAPGTIAVGARDLFDRARMMPEGELTISTTDGSTTTLKSSGSMRRYTLNGIPGEEFPALPEPDAAASGLELPASVLSKLIAATYFSISTDETRLHLNSALFEWEGESVRMVTTDGHRLGKIEVKVAGKRASSSMLIPLKGVLELKRLCDEALSEAGSGETPMVRMVQSGTNAFFTLAGFQFSVKLVDAQFPPYEQVIPQTTERVVRAPRLALSEALRAVSIAASDRTGGVKLTVSRGKLRFESESPESGAGFDELPVDYDGAEVTIGFNAKYFLDVAAAIDDEEVMLGISGELDPAVIRPGHDTAESSYVAVIMPMRI
jgi:DNA polymerase III subunit beta